MTRSRGASHDGTPVSRRGLIPLRDQLARLLSWYNRLGGVALRTFVGIGLGLLEGFGVLPVLTRPLVLPPEALLIGTLSPTPSGFPSRSFSFSLSCLPHSHPFPARLFKDANHRAFLASRSRFSARLSKVERYLSYPSLNVRSTLEEKINSPRGLVVGGIGGIGNGAAVEDAEGDDGEERVGEGMRGEYVGGGAGRGKRKDSGLYGNFDLNGGFRMFRYILNDRKALLACGTYLR